MKKTLNFIFGFIAILAMLLVSCDGVEDGATYNVTVSANAHGTVIIENYSGNSVDVPVGSNVKLIAVPNENSYFAGWYVDNDSKPIATNETFLLWVIKPTVVKAVFNKYPEAIDLGLSSGIKWAEFNIGANTPEEYGDYFAWGETKKKTDFTWDNYAWCKGSAYTILKYCDNNTYGSFDCKILLDLEDDVANATLGGEWRMPTMEEQKELLNECTWEWTTVDDVNGYKATGPNGNSIFFPAAGFRYGKELYDAGRRGCYWASTLTGDYCYKACGLGIYDSAFEYNDSEQYNCGWYYYDRYLGHTVRPVCK